MSARTLAGIGDGAGCGSLAPALAASVVLHAALLAGLPDLWTYSERPATAPLNAWLVPAAPAAATPEPAAAAAPTPPEPRRPPRKPAGPAATPIAALAERSEPLPSPAREPTPEPAGAGSAPPAASMGDAAPVLALGVPTLAPRAGEDALEAGSLAQYRLALIGAAKRLKLYPPQAIDRGLEGRVEIRLVVGAGGEPAVTVKRSSGHEILDRQAIDTLRRAAAATAIPPALREREIAVEIPVVFELKNAS
jgi:protein TonB